MFSLLHLPADVVFVVLRQRTVCIFPLSSVILWMCFCLLEFLFTTFTTTRESFFGFQFSSSFCFVFSHSICRQRDALTCGITVNSVHYNLCPLCVCMCKMAKQYRNTYFPCFIRCTRVTQAEKENEQFFFSSKFSCNIFVLLLLLLSKCILGLSLVY